MGACFCREKRRGSSASAEAQAPPPSRPSVSAVAPRRPRRPQHRQTSVESTSMSSDFGGASNIGNDVKELIKQTLFIIRSLVNNDQEPPTALLKLNMIADKEKGWLLVVRSMVEVVPDDDPLGPAVITLFLDESPLPTKEAVGRLLFQLSLRGSSPPSPSTVHKTASWHRNACIVLGCLAEKLAGASSVALCTQATLDYLFNNLAPTQPPQVILFSLIALEKLAQTSENRHTICRAFEAAPEHPLEVLERWLTQPPSHYDADNALVAQVAFCSQWSLDNIFVSPGRRYAYLDTDVREIRAMLNHEDVSEYLKIGPNGLEARCDVSSFESVRCTFEAHSGVWYYEALILTPGVMQIGFATKRSRFLNHEGYGIGDDESSVAYDGCRQLLWHNANSTKHEHPAWKPGDILGCLLDLTVRRIVFSLNGVPLSMPNTDFLSKLRPYEGVFAAASFMSFQQCRFNFGAAPFRFPPSGIVFSTFNEVAEPLTEQQRTILPRRRRLEILQRTAIPDDYCNLCYAHPPDTVLSPCTHGGLCSTCAAQLDICPLCRVPIQQRILAAPKSSIMTTPESPAALIVSLGNVRVQTDV